MRSKPTIASFIIHKLRKTRITNNKSLHTFFIFPIFPEVFIKLGSLMDFT